MKSTSKRGAKSVAVLALAAAAVFLSVAPASAASNNGSRNCVSSPYTVYLSINSSTSGSGTWQNVNTGATKAITFPGGASTRYSGYLNAQWVISNGSSGFWYSTPASGCSV